MEYVRHAQKPGDIFVFKSLFIIAYNYMKKISEKKAFYQVILKICKKSFIVKTFFKIYFIIRLTFVRFTFVKLKFVRLTFRYPNSNRTYHKWLTITGEGTKILFVLLPILNRCSTYDLVKYEQKSCLAKVHVIMYYNIMRTVIFDLIVSKIQ